MFIYIYYIREAAESDKVSLSRTHTMRSDIYSYASIRAPYLFTARQAQRGRFLFRRTYSIHIYLYVILIEARAAIANDARGGTATATASANRV